MSTYSHDENDRLVITTEICPNVIYVLESLDEENESLTGKMLHEGLLEDLCNKEGRPKSHYASFETRDNLLRLLTIIENCAKKGAVPIIHIEAHGTEDKTSFFLKSGETVPFEDLLASFREINMACRHNLLICAAACHGGFLFTILRNSLSQPAPFWGVCGPSDAITPAQVKNGYWAFYDEVIRTGKVRAALEKMREGGHKSFSIWNSEYLFLKAFRKYLETCCRPSAVIERCDRVVKAAERKAGGNLDKSAYMSFVLNKFTSRDGREKSFNRMKNSFFMHDIYPELRKEYNPSFDDMMKMTVNTTNRHKTT
jgi:hypothetical protein